MKDEGGGANALVDESDTRVRTDSFCIWKIDPRAYEPDWAKILYSTIERPIRGNSDAK